MFYGLIRNYPGRSSQAVEEQTAEGWSSETRGGEGQGTICGPILMSTKGNILFFSGGILLVHRSKSLSHKQGISHHAFGLAW